MRIDEFEREECTGAVFNQKYSRNIYVVENKCPKFEMFSQNLGSEFRVSVLAMTETQLPRHVNQNTKRLMRIYITPDAEIKTQKHFVKVVGFIPLEILDISKIPMWRIPSFQLLTLQANWHAVFFIPNPTPKAIEYANVRWSKFNSRFPERFRIPVETFPELD